MPELAKLAHRMAGAAFSLHLGGLAAACRSLEDSARMGRRGAAAEVEALGVLWAESVAALEEALNQ